jgi:hypothetical protein
VDTVVLLKQLAPLWGLDPAMIRAPQPPQPEPIEKPKASVSFKMDDFAVGYAPQAAGFEREARDFASLAATAKSVTIRKITVQHG